MIEHLINFYWRRTEKKFCRIKKKNKNTFSLLYLSLCATVQLCKQFSIGKYFFVRSAHVCYVHVCVFVCAARCFCTRSTRNRGDSSRVSHIQIRKQFAMALGWLESRKRNPSRAKPSQVELSRVESKPKSCGQIMRNAATATTTATATPTQQCIGKRKTEATNSRSRTEYFEKRSRCTLHLLLTARVIQAAAYHSVTWWQQQQQHDSNSNSNGSDSNSTSRARKPTQVATRVLATCCSVVSVSVPFFIFFWLLAHVKDRGADGLAWTKVSWPKAAAFICITTATTIA